MTELVGSDIVYLLLSDYKSIGKWPVLRRILSVSETVDNEAGSEKDFEDEHGSEAENEREVSEKLTTTKA